MLAGTAFLAMKKAYDVVNGNGNMSALRFPPRELEPPARQSTEVDHRSVYLKLHL